MKMNKDERVIVLHSNTIRSLLSEGHCLAQMYYCLAQMHYCMSKVNLESNEIHDFYDRIHVDEKWFFISEATFRLHLAPGEAQLK
jgi:hypothetical protein